MTDMLALQHSDWEFTETDLMVFLIPQVYKKSELPEKLCTSQNTTLLPKAGIWLFQFESF